MVVIKVTFNSTTRLLLASLLLTESVLAGNLSKPAANHRLRRQVDYFEYDGKKSVKRFIDKRIDSRDFTYEYENEHSYYETDGVNSDNGDNVFLDDVDCPDLITSDFGEFFSGSSTATVVADIARATGDPTAGVGFNVVSSFLTSDVSAETATQLDPSSLATRTSSGTDATSTSISPPTEQVSMSSSTAAVASQVVVSANTNQGLGFNVISTGLIDSAALAVETQASNSFSVSSLDATSTSKETTSSAVTPSTTFVATSTGIGVVEMGFVTVATFTAGEESTPSSSDSAAPTDSPISSAESPAASAAQANASVVIPGQKLSVLPIGLGVFGGLALLAIIVVGYVTYERKKYRKQFRSRKIAERMKDALSMRQTRVGNPSMAAPRTI